MAEKFVINALGAPFDKVTDLFGSVAGTTNQVSVADDGDGTITLSLPQNIHTAATPQFARLGLGTAADSSKVITGSGDGSLSGYLRVGSNSTPTNTTAGTFTATRIMLGSDGGFSNNASFQLNGTTTITSGAYDGVLALATSSHASNSTATIRGFSFQARAAGASGATIANLIANGGFNLILQDGAITQSVTFSGIPVVYSTTTPATAGTITTAKGYNTSPFLLSAGTSTGTITTFVGYDVVGHTTAGASIGDYLGFRMDNPGASVSTITTMTGIYIQDLTRATTNRGIRLALSSGSNKHNIYADGTAQNYFAGRVGIGETTPLSKLHITGTSGWIVQDEQDTDPTTTELDANDSIAVYSKNNKLVFAYNNGGTMTYVKLALDGSATAWTHDTTAP